MRAPAGRGRAEREAMARAARRLAPLMLYPAPLDTSRVRILHTPRLFALPWFRRFAGYNMGSLILIRDRLCEVSDDLICHELCHVWQDQDHRLAMWLSYLTVGYSNNPHEREAREAVALTRSADG